MTGAHQLGWAQSISAQPSAVGEGARGPLEFGRPSVVDGAGSTAIVCSRPDDREVAISEATGWPTPCPPGESEPVLCAPIVLRTGTRWDLADTDGSSSPVSGRMRALGVLGSAMAGALAVSLVAAGPVWAAATWGEGPGGTISVGASDGASAPGTPGTPVESGAAGGSGSGIGGGRGAASGGPWVCTYTSLLLNDVGGFAPGGPTPGGWYSVTCFNRVTGAGTTQTEWITQGVAAAPATPATPATPAIDPRVLAVQAENALKLPPPSLRFNPAASSVVNLPTWLWIDGSLWHNYSVTASAGAVRADRGGHSGIGDLGDGGRWRGRVLGPGPALRPIPSCPGAADRVRIHLPGHLPWSALARR